MTDEIQYIKCGNEFTYKNRQFNGYTSKERIQETENFQFLPTDIVICTFPRNGTTLTQEIVWQIMNRHEVTKGQKVSGTDERSQFLEFDLDEVEHPNFVEVANELANKPHRILKTHLPYDMLRGNLEKARPKLIFVMRNPKDTVVSNYHFYKNVYNHKWNGDFNDFFEIFMHGKTWTGDYFVNLLEWYSLKSQDNVLILKYEDLLKHSQEKVKEIANFLGQSLTQEDLEKILYNSSFQTMSKNSNINIDFGGFTFLRKGQIGDWKNYLSPSQENRIMEKVNTCFDSIGLKFDYE